MGVPQYLVEDYPDILIPQNILENAMYRELFINGSRGIGGTCAVDGDCTDYIAMYSNRAGHPFDDPTYDKPTVWGSKDGYMMSTYANDLLKTYPIGTGMNVSFTTTASWGETLLFELVSDMYAHRLPFMANTYTPNQDFGKIDDVTGDLPQFEKLAFPRNPDQSANDICFQQNRCQYQISPLMKAANPRLNDTFPEAFQFYKAYYVPTTQVNLLISKFLERQDDTGSVLEKWLNAACDWMKDPSSQEVWNRASWNISIDRYKCSETCS